MDKTLFLWLLSDYLFQAVKLTCVKPPRFVEICVEFGRFPLGEEVDHYSVTYSTGTNQWRWMNIADVNECTTNCKIDISDFLEMEACNININAIRNNAVLGTKTIHIDPIPNLSFRTETTSTSAVFTWSPQAGEHTVSFRLDGRSWAVPRHETSYRVAGLQPGKLHRFTMEIHTHIQALNVTVTRKQDVPLQMAQCPLGWVHSGRNCYRTWRKGKAWHEAGRACRTAATGAHLVNMETEEEFLFITSHLQSFSHLVLVWTGLSDVKQEGELLWTDGSAFGLKSVVTSSLPPNQTDCFALHMNATGPSYYFTGFFCYMPLPYMCHYKIPSPPSDFTFALEEFGETEAHFTWSSLSSWPTAENEIELLILYWDKGSTDKPHQRALLFNTPEVIVQGLSPGHVYFFSLMAKHPSGATGALDSTLTVMTRPRPPLNITVNEVTSKEIPVKWMAPDLSHNALFHHYLVTCADVETGVEKILMVENYTTSAVISGLEPYWLYSITVQAVTAHGLQSCVDTPLYVITGKCTLYWFEIVIHCQLYFVCPCFFSTLSWIMLSVSILNAYLIIAM
ncbi:hypothetical protein GN956_G3693 [Arapaima gigas]